MPALITKLFQEIFQAMSTLNLKETLENDYHAFLKEVTYINVIRIRAIGTLCIFLFIPLTGLDIHYYLSGRWALSPGYRVLLIAHCLILILLGLSLLIFWKKPLNTPQAAGSFHKHTVNSTIFLGLFNLVLICYGDILISGSIAAYLGSIFAIASIFLMSNRLCLVMFLTNMALMIMLLINTPSLTGLLIRIQLINVTAFTLIAMALSRILFYYQIKDFRNRILIRRQRERLEELSMKDPLTQAANRRSFQEISQMEIARSNRHQTPLALAILDLDHFKAINDTCGHCAGDDVLVELSNLVRQNIRKVDTFARWGGEEFLILSPQTDMEGMVRLAEKIRTVTEQHDFPHGSTVTISFGVTQYRPEESWDEFIQRSDKALYQAKQNGRNRVEILH